jgi:hypothetical protein
MDEKNYLDIKMSKIALTETNSLEDTWVSDCCKIEKKLSKGFLKWIVQVSISITILVWSLFQISTTEDNREIYFSLISTIIGIYLPSPDHKE